MIRHLIALGLALLAIAAHGQKSSLTDDRRNWFEDPFFQVSSGIAACPPAEGPLLTFDEQRREAHWRAERGTSCWLAGRCRDSNAYRYDKTLAPAVESALRAVPDIAASSLWVTIQRRWVFLQGCAASADQASRIEAAVKAVTEVEAIVPQIMLDPSATPPYAVVSPPGR